MAIFALKLIYGPGLFMDGSKDESKERFRIELAGRGDGRVETEKVIAKMAALFKCNPGKDPIKRGFVCVDPLNGLMFCADEEPDLDDLLFDTARDIRDEIVDLSYIFISIA